MNAGELTALFRTEVSDIEKPYLWGDDEVMTYLNDAYTMLIRFVGGVPDATSSITDLAVSIGDTSVQISPAILRIVRAFRETDGEEISVIESTDIPLIRNSNGKLALMKIGSQVGKVEYLVMGLDRNMVSFFPTPDSAETIKLHVRRLPVTPITSPTNELSDVGFEHHIHLLKWMKSMAYRKQDVDTLDMEKAQLNESLFLQYCEQAAYEQAKLRRKSIESIRNTRDRHNPMLAARTERVYGSGPAPQRVEREG